MVHSVYLWPVLSPGYSDVEYRQAIEFYVTASERSKPHDSLVSHEASPLHTKGTHGTYLSRQFQMHHDLAKSANHRSPRASCIMQAVRVITVRLTTYI